MKYFSVAAVTALVSVFCTFYGCSSTNHEGSKINGGPVYSLREVELRDQQILFSLKNCSDKKIINFTVYFEFSGWENGDVNLDELGFEKTFYADIESGERIDFSILLKDFEKLETIYEDFWGDLAEKNIYIARIYAKEIVFETINEDNSKSNLFWKDPYGSWYF